MMICNEDGSVMINSGLAENGQGLRQLTLRLLLRHWASPTNPYVFLEQIPIRSLMAV